MQEKNVTYPLDTKQYRKIIGLSTTSRRIDAVTAPVEAPAPAPLPPNGALIVRSLQSLRTGDYRGGRDSDDN